MEAMAESSPIWVDFNTLSTVPDGRWFVSLTTFGSQENLRRRCLTLNEGLRLNLYMDDASGEGAWDDLVVSGTVQRHPVWGSWVALVERAQIKHVSEIVGDPDHCASSVDWAALHTARPSG
jgi:hypothetical protein